MRRSWPRSIRPRRCPMRSALWRGAGAGARATTRLLPWLDSAPQTNEVGRSAVLMSGLLVVAAALPPADRALRARRQRRPQPPARPLRLRSRRAARRAIRASAVRAEARTGRARRRPTAAVRIARRRGVDLNPLDVPANRERLLAYVWPDQAQRLAQLARRRSLSPPPIRRAVDAGDAADWIEARLEPAGAEPASPASVMHSVAFQYFPPTAQQRVAAPYRGGRSGGDARTRRWPGCASRSSRATTITACGCAPGRAGSSCSPGPIRTASRGPLAG